MATKTQKPPRPADQPRNRDARAPATPIKLPRHSWGGVFKRTIGEFRDDNLTDLAAALTYYGILAIFPALIALVSILGLIGHSATQVGRLLGIGGTAVTVWDIAKWPVLLLVVSLMCAILYWAAPNVKHPGFTWISPGGLVAVALWVIASGAFALYVANFSSYNKT